MSTENMEVKEIDDGSAVVELPESMTSPDSEQENDGGTQDEQLAEGGSVGSDDDDQPGDTDALREAKRQRRKAKRELVKQTNAEKDVRLQMLQRQNEELLQRLSVVERKTHSVELARIDKAIEDQELRLQYAKMKISEATKARDGDALAAAQEAWYEARQQAEALRALKTRAAEPKQDTNLPDPRLQRNAAGWMERNPWFKPNATDEDSKIAKMIDEKLTSEGWDATKEDYWEELDNRLQRYLPHRYNSNTDDIPSRRSKPRSIVSGSGRESAVQSGGKNTFTLSPERVRAMKDAGMWDDPQKRKKMIEAYAKSDRQNQGYRS